MIVKLASLYENSERDISEFPSQYDLIPNDNHLVCKRTLNQLAKTASSKEFFDIQANYRVQIHSETRMWYDNNIQSIWSVFEIFSSRLYLEQMYAGSLNYADIDYWNKKIIEKTASAIFSCGTLLPFLYFDFLLSVILSS